VTAIHTMFIDCYSQLKEQESRLSQNLQI